MKFKIAAVALFCSVAMICSDSNADLLGRMLGRGDCGGCQTVSSCCDTPAPVCGGRNFGMSININIGMPGRLFRGNNCGGGLFSGKGCGGGCGGGVVANIGDSGCGCAPAPAVADNCCGAVADDGCGRRGCDLFGRLRGRLGNLGSRGNSCGCEAPAPSCGPTCGDTGCGCGGSGLFKGGLLGSLRGGMSGGCGCGSAPVADCGCGSPAPAMDCGCDDGCDDGCGGGLLSKCQLRGRLSGLFSRMKPSGCNSCGAPAGDCGCGSVAPVYSAPVADCGCGGGCDGGCGNAFGSRIKNIGQGFGSRLRARCSACGRSACDGGCSGGRLNLLSRFRGDRNSCDDGCSNSGCNSCAGGAVQYNGDSNVQPMQMQNLPTQAVPVMDQAPSINGAVEVPAAAAPEGAFYRRPVVDPSAFVIKK